jgi:hypothetical protein
MIPWELFRITFNLMPKLPEQLVHSLLMDASTKQLCSGTLFEREKADGLGIRIHQPGIFVPQENRVQYRLASSGDANNLKPSSASSR